jgi:hypothetical protein
VKKVFPLVSERHEPARLVEQIKSERNKSLPEVHDYWGFNCRSGQASDLAKVCHEKEIGKSLDHALAEGWEVVYLEILAEPRKRGAN